MNEEYTDEQTMTCLVKEVSTLRGQLAEKDDLIAKMKAEFDAVKKAANQEGFIQGVNQTLDRFLPSKPYNEPFLQRTIIVGPAIKKEEE